MFFRHFSNVLLIPVALFGFIAFGLVNINGAWQQRLDAEAEGIHLSRLQMAEELDQAYDLLNRYHPYAHLYRTRRELDQILASIKADIREDNDLATAFMLHTRLMASVCDHHTAVAMGKDRLSRQFELFRAKSTFWPIKSRPLEIRGGKVMAEIDDYMRPLAEINGTSAEKVRDLLEAVWPKDGCAPPKTLNTRQFSPFYEFVLQGMWDERNKVHYSYAIPDSTAQIKGELDVEEILKKQKRRSKYAPEFRFLRDAGFENERMNKGRSVSVWEPYFFHSREKGVVYLHLPDFKSYGAVAGDYKAIFSNIRAFKPKTLVLDLRDSGGGDVLTEALIAALLGVDTAKVARYNVYRHGALHLPKNFDAEGILDNFAFKLEAEMAQKEPRVGDNHMILLNPDTFDVPVLESKLYVLIGQNTASAAGILAAQLRHYRGATLVGMPTTVRANRMCSKASGTFAMPHSKLKLRIPLVCLYDRNLPDGRVEPDILIDGYPTSLGEREMKSLAFVMNKL